VGDDDLRAPARREAALVARFFVPAADVADGQATLGGGEFRHLQRVLRLREGDQVTLFDDGGREHAGVIVSLTPRVAVVRITASTTPARESPLAITLYQGVPKGRKMDLVVEKATELGVAAIVPFASAFSAGAATVTASKRERWRRIATAAAKQSARTRIPEVAAALTFPEVLAAARPDAATAGTALALLLFEGADAPALAAVRDPARAPASAAVVVGPEGGFSRDEVAAARDAGFQVVGAGPRILRTETAALVAVALVQARWGDLTRES
jgi:16S rRNA (uracil1498-N3)-methyltransferase